MADLVTLISGAEPETALPAEIQTAITNLGNFNALTAALADPNTEAAASYYTGRRSPAGHRDGLVARLQCLVEQFVASPAVEALDEVVLLRFSRRDVVPADAGLVRPGEDGV
jgi:hypothetical protein